MFVAVDDKEERIYAGSDETYQNCFCPVRGERLRHKNKGKIRKPYFAHIEKTNCELEKNKDYNNKWHTQMEKLLPIETREYRFVDNKTKENAIYSTCNRGGQWTSNWHMASERARLYISLK